MMKTKFNPERFKRQIAEEVYALVRDYQDWLKNRSAAPNILAKKNQTQEKIKRIFLLAELAVMQNKTYQETIKLYKDKKAEELEESILKLRLAPLFRLFDLNDIAEIDVTLFQGERPNPLRWTICCSRNEDGTFSYMFIGADRHQINGNLEIDPEAFVNINLDNSGSAILTTAQKKQIADAVLMAHPAIAPEQQEKQKLAQRFAATYQTLPAHFDSLLPNDNQAQAQQPCAIGYLFPVFLGENDSERTKEIYSYFDPFIVSYESRKVVDAKLNFNRLVHEQITLYSQGKISKFEALANIYDQCFDRLYNLDNILNTFTDYKKIKSAYEGIIKKFEKQIAEEANSSDDLEIKRLHGYIRLKNFARAEQLKDQNILTSYYKEDEGFKSHVSARQERNLELEVALLIEGTARVTIQAVHAEAEAAVKLAAAHAEAKLARAGLERLRVEEQEFRAAPQNEIISEEVLQQWQEAIKSAEEKITETESAVKEAELNVKAKTAEVENNKTSPRKNFELIKKKIKELKRTDDDPIAEGHVRILRATIQGLKLEPNDAENQAAIIKILKSENVGGAERQPDDYRKEIAARAARVAKALRLIDIAQETAMLEVTIQEQQLGDVRRRAEELNLSDVVIEERVRKQSEILRESQSLRERLLAINESEDVKRQQKTVESFLVALESQASAERAERRLRKLNAVGGSQNKSLSDSTDSLVIRKPKLTEEKTQEETIIESSTLNAQQAAQALTELTEQQVVDLEQIAFAATRDISKFTQESDNRAQKRKAILRDSAVKEYSNDRQNPTALEKCVRESYLDKFDSRRDYQEEFRAMYAQAVDARAEAGKKVSELNNQIHERSVSEPLLRLQPFNSADGKYEDDDSADGAESSNRSSAEVEETDLPTLKSDYTKALKVYAEKHEKVCRINAFLESSEPERFNLGQTSQDKLISEILETFEAYHAAGTTQKKHGFERNQKVGFFLQAARKIKVVDEQVEPEQKLIMLVKALEALENALAAEDKEKVLRRAKGSELYKLTINAIEKVYNSTRPNVQEVEQQPDQAQAVDADPIGEIYIKANEHKSLLNSSWFSWMFFADKQQAKAQLEKHETALEVLKDFNPRAMIRA